MQVAMVTDLLSCANCPPTLNCTAGYMTRKTRISCLGEKLVGSSDVFVCPPLGFSRTEMTMHIRHCLHLLVASIIR